MSHGWRGRMGQMVGVAIVGGLVGCVGTDKAKLPPKLGMPATLPPPSNISGAGALPATPPGGVPTSTTSNTKSVPVTTASRTPATTPDPTTIPAATRSPVSTNLGDAHERMNTLTARPNDVTPVFPSPTPGITYATAPRPAPPAAKSSVAVPSDPPPVMKASGPPLGLSNTLPTEQPIAASNPAALVQPFKTPELPAPGQASPPADGPLMPVAPLSLGQ